MSANNENPEGFLKALLAKWAALCEFVEALFKGALWLSAFALLGYCQLTGGDDKDSLEPPETLPISEYENVRVNVYFYLPNDREVHLGSTKGTSSCQSKAYRYAESKELGSHSNWSYICCTIEAGSDCYRKIR
ncbi:MAG: hypothetical protein P8P30_10325 [Rickettsiales bacterium]|nr:hypothetical protein [Rickettsiales bacterium]